MLPEQVVPRLRGGFGRPYILQDECDSTQELAWPLPQGGVVACDLQQPAVDAAAAHGEHRRAALLFSLALEPRTPPQQLAAFSLVAADAVAAVCHPHASVRWPRC